MNIGRKEFIDQLADRYGYTKKSAALVVDDFIETILSNLERGDTVSFYGFGSFDILERKARKCRNPQTGEDCPIPAHWIPRFYPGSRMRVAVKKWEAKRDRG